VVKSSGQLTFYASIKTLQEAHVRNRNGGGGHNFKCDIVQKHLGEAVSATFTSAIAAASILGFTLLFQDKSSQPQTINTIQPPRSHTPANMAPQEEEAAKQRESSDREFARLWRAWRTVHEMVQDRVCA
jgi:hypothetical protein